MYNEFQEFDVYCHSHLLCARKNVQMVVDEVQYWCPVAAPNTCTIYLSVHQMPYPHLAYHMRGAAQHSYRTSAHVQLSLMLWPQ